MIKMRVSCETPRELEYAVQLVKPYAAEIKTVEPRENQYYRAYITLKSIPINSEKGREIRPNS